MKTTIDLPKTVIASNHASMERQLDEAVDAALTLAMLEEGQGILVTQHGPGSFTVDLSDAVPFGLTRELRDW